MSDLSQAMSTGGTGRSGQASPNFGFLAEHNPLLVHYASQAERYVFEDPNTALINLWQFAEVLAQEAAARAGVYDPQNESLSDILARLSERGMWTRDVADLFHGLRKAVIPPPINTRVPAAKRCTS